MREEGRRLDREGVSTGEKSGKERREGERKVGEERGERSITGASRGQQTEK